MADEPSQTQPNTNIPESPPIPNQEPVGATPRSGRTKFLIIAAVLILIGGAIGLYAYTQQTKPKEVIRIGIMGTFSGEADTGSYPELRGAQLAQKELNATDVEFVQVDTQCDSELSPGAMQELVSKKVVAVIGDACSSSSLTALPIANENKIVMISPSASSTSLSTPGDYFFRVVPPDTFQGEFLAKLLIDKGIKKAGIAYTDEDYGKGLTAIFTENFEKLGGTVVASESIERDVIDATSQVAALKAANPEAVVILNNSFASGVAIMKQARAVGMQAPFFGADGIYDAALLTSGDAVEGLTVTSFSTGSEEFKQAYLAEYGASADIDQAPQSYDAFKALYLAIQKGARTGEDIAKTLPTIKFQGATGAIAFDENGDVSEGYEYTALQIKDGEFVPQDN